MAIQQFSGGLWVPDYNYFNGVAGPSVNSVMLMDAATEKVAMLFRAPKSGTLGKIRFRTGPVTKNANNTTSLRVSLQDVDLTTGDPDGVVDQYRLIPNASLASNTVIQTGLITSDGTDTGTKRTVSEGDLLAIVWDYTTFNTSDSIVINTVTISSKQAPIMTEYADLYTGTWGKQLAVMGMASVEYDDGTYAYIPSLYPCTTGNVSTLNLNTGTNPNVAGLKFRFPFPCQIRGCYFGVSGVIDCDLVLYGPSGSTTVVSMDKDVRATSSTATDTLHFTRFTAGPQTILANTDYVLGVKPTSATNTTLFYTIHTAAAELDQFCGGQNFHYASAQNPTQASSFTAVTTRRPSIGLMISAIDDGVSVPMSRVSLGM